MPTYDYFCSHCGHKKEVFQKITADRLTTCDQCHKETLVRKPGGGIALAFSGDGFYATMYGKDAKKEENTPKIEENTQKKETSNEGGCCPCGKDTPCSPS
ncbi:MAG: FmdB family zinc ribbon protein [Parachlamydiaceae bacterium]